MQNKIPEKNVYIERVEKFFIENPELIKQYALHEMIRRKETLKRISFIPFDFSISYKKKHSRNHYYKIRQLDM